ncbi:MAG: hypothetical protein ACLP9L_16390 [Thermoguttaceae bacterium]
MTRVFLAAALVASAVAAQADTINLGGGWNINWDINSSPTVSPTQDIQIQNAAASSNPIFNGYDLGLVFQRLSGSGQIALDTASNPLSNSIVPNWVGVPTLGQGSNTNGAGLEAYIGNEALDSNVDYSIPDQETSLVTVDFMAGATTPTIGSVFEVLSDNNWSDYFDHTGTVVTPYANNVNNYFPLGTITVVPEPGCLVLLGVAGAGFLIHCVRRGSDRRDARAALGT